MENVLHASHATEYHVWPGVEIKGNREREVSAQTFAEIIVCTVTLNKKII